MLATVVTKTFLDRWKGEVIGALSGDDAKLPARDDVADTLARAAVDGTGPSHETDNDNLWNGGTGYDMTGGAPVSRTGPAASPSASGVDAGFGDANFDVADTLAEQMSLRDAVTEQIIVEFAEPADRAIALALDRNGHPTSPI